MTQSEMIFNVKRRESSANSSLSEDASALLLVGVGQSFTALICPIKRQSGCNSHFSPLTKKYSPGAAAGPDGCGTREKIGMSSRYTKTSLLSV